MLLFWHVLEYHFCVNTKMCHLLWLSPVFNNFFPVLICNVFPLLLFVNFFIFLVSIMAEFSLFTFNILSPLLTNKEAFPNISDDLLDEEYRKEVGLLCTFRYHIKVTIILLTVILLSWCSIWYFNMEQGWDESSVCRLQNFVCLFVSILCRWDLSL